MSYRPVVRLGFALLLTAGHAAQAHAAPACLGGASTGFTLNGLVKTPKRFTPRTLATHASSKATVSYFSGASGLVTKTFVGVALYDLVKEAVVITDATRKNDLLRKYLVVNATDCYQVVVALAEIQPSFGGQQAMVAYATVDETGAVVPLDETEGAVKLVMPGDKAGGRNVFHLNAITVRSAP